MRIDWYISSLSTGFYKDLLGTVDRALTQNSWTSRCVVDQVPEASREEGVLQIVVAPHEFRANFLTGQLGWSEKQVQQSFRSCAALTAEGFKGSILRDASAFSGLLEVSQEAAAAWSAKGVRSAWLPVPFYSLSKTESVLAPLADREIDFGFIGIDTAHRRELFARFAGGLDPYRNSIRFVRHQIDLPDARTGALFGEARAQWVQKCKVLVDIGAAPEAPFDWFRYSVALGGGCIFLTDRCVPDELGGGHSGIRTLRSDQGFELPSSVLPGTDREIENARSRFREICAPERLQTILSGLMENNELSAPVEIFQDTGVRRSLWTHSSPRNNSVFHCSLLASGDIQKSGKFWTMPDKEAFFWIPHLPPLSTVSSIPFRFSVEVSSNRKLTLDLIAEFGTEEGIHSSDVVRLNARRVGFRRFVYEGEVELAEDIRILRLKILGPAKGRFHFSGPPPSLERHPMSAVMVSLEKRIEKHSKQITDILDTMAPLLARHARFAAQAREGTNEDRLVVARNLEDPVLLSFVVPVFNYEKYLLEALDSISLAGSLIPGQRWEVVIVDDASNDGSLEVARLWGEKSGGRASVLSMGTNRGVAAARNAGIEHSLGKWIFLLDADNQVLPHGPLKLVEQAEESEASAVYGMLATFAESEDFKRDLLSFYSWDPEEIVRRPEVDAMAIYRKAVLQRLGGFDSEMRFETVGGWEDYDFWLRLIDAAEPVSFLPDLVGLYRRHSNSMIGRTNREKVLLPAYLRRRYPNLLDKFKIEGHAFGE